MKLYATTDFYDEIVAAVWTPERLLKYFQLMRSKGISRVYWINQKEIMESCGQDEVSANMAATKANFAGRIPETAVKLAHEAGLEIFDLIKPYECGPLSPALSPDAEKRPHLTVAGGICDRFTEFAKVHPEAMLQRLPVPEHGDAATLTVHFSAPLRQSATLKLFASETNSGYELAEAKSVPQGAREITFARPVGKKFFVFQSDTLIGGNTYQNLVTVADAAGRYVPYTLAIQPKRRYAPKVYHLDRSRPADDADFRTLGMLFDYFPGIPSGLYTSNLAPEWFFDFPEAEQHAVGVTLELNERIVGFPNPEHPAFRAMVAEWLKRDLAMGFDGVEVRVSSHSSPIFWRDYGFGPEVRRARGEAHHELLRMISQEVHRAGKKLGVHIEDFMYNSTPEKPQPMEFFWDYPTWIRERLMDEVTAKIIFTDGLAPANFALAEVCRKAGMPVNNCPFLQSVSQPLVFASWSAQAGFDAFNIYETATVWQANRDDDGFTEINPALLAQLCRIPDVEVSQC